MSPFRSPSPLKRCCRAKAKRNHNPRVGGSSPSSGIAVVGRFPRSGRRFARIGLSVVRPQQTATNRWWLTFVSNGVSNEDLFRARIRVSLAALQIRVEPLRRIVLLGLRQELRVPLDHLQIRVTHELISSLSV